MFDSRKISIVYFLINMLGFSGDAFSINAQANAQLLSDSIITYQKVHEQAIAGNPEAQYQFAVLCRDGIGTKRDSIEAVKWFRAAAEQGNAKSQEALALALMSGNGVGQDDLEAVKWITLAAQQQSPSALYMLANFYLIGENVEKNISKAYQLFSASADQGLAKGMLRQADMLIYGKGVKKNVYDGLLLYEKAALAGDHFAQVNLPKLTQQKLCLFSAKTQLFGRYLKCVSAKNLHRQLLKKKTTVVRKTGRTKIVYDSSKILVGSRILEVLITSNDSIASLEYTFKQEDLRFKSLESGGRPMPRITKIRKKLERKYGGYANKFGVLGAGEVTYQWLLSDNVVISLQQQSLRSEVYLSYSLPDRLAHYYEARQAEELQLLNKSFVMDSDVY